MNNTMTLGLALVSALLAVALAVAGCAEAVPSTDDEPEPSVESKLSVADATVTEGDTGTGNAVFRVTLAPAAGVTVQVSWATADRTATAGSDYRAANGRLTFQAGQTSQSITVVVLSDLLSEADEQFTVTLHSPSNATLADATATGTIRDDDDEPAGDTFRDCAACPRMVPVPAGSYLMGSPATEAGRHEDEEQRTVTIADPFAVGMYEVTFAQWDACVAAGGCGGHRPDDGGWGRGRRPVINVSWEDAQAYVAWLSTETGEDYRLLTEAEWEYVARAGTTTPFHTGATISTDQANYDGQSSPYGAGVRGIYRARTIEVGSFGANAFGLHDVHGNAAELVQDCYEDTDGGATTCSRRVVRGGSWANGPELLRLAYRGWCAPTLRNDLNGFRVARTK
jgi:formylglycine-generating enzyme required for sulfatase activity